MTRFEADTAVERRKLFADAVLAHRNRGSQFLTVEAAPDPEADGQNDTDDEAEAEADQDQVPPWVQFAEQTVNLDVTDDELDRLKALVDDFPEFRIDQLDSPEEAEGTNVRITARSDANRVSEFLDRVFLDVFERPEDYTAYVVQI